MGPILDQLQSRLVSLIDDDANTEATDYGSILEDLPLEQLPKASVILDLIKQKLANEPVDDRKLVIERTIGIIANLPETSKARKKVTGVLVDQLWNSLQHPPLTYVGDLYQYRQADGSHNNTMYPQLGKAGTPYARTVRAEVKGGGAKPDPGLLFDLLMSRGEFEENPAGISSMLIYHASIITHDIFHTDRQDVNINGSSSYLDLAPLYGNSKEAQDRVRLGKEGLLRPDTFSERRLLAFPPGVNVMLVMYSRFHNSTAQTLAAINEGGRFTPPRHLGPEEGLKWRDEQLFQVARMVTNGLYVNICLHDYLRAIANVPATDSSWTLDPRIEVKKIFDKRGTPRGIGNQVSCEFNLLYRFHSSISDRDTKWTEEFYRSLFAGEADVASTGTREDPSAKLFRGITKYEQSIPLDPSVRTFDGLKRGKDGKFNDADLVKILKESIEDPAGRFGANHVPEIMKPVEILGILQARKWRVASLNEFRKFFDLKPYKTFEEINPDPYVADTLRHLYGGDVNQVELYPGMFLEATKPRMDPGMGLCAPYTVTRAVFSDAITLVRADRFLTLDYTPANLTNWGITEVETDFDFLGGAKMHHLILNAFPNFFKFNSVYAAQPFYTPAENKKIFTKLGNADSFSFDPPTQGRPIIPIISHEALRTVLSDKKNFRVPWGAKMSSLETYMLASDRDESEEQRCLVSRLMYGDVPADSFQTFAHLSETLTRKLLDKESYPLGRNGVRQVDIVAKIGNLAALHFASEICHLPLLSKTQPSYTEEELYKILTDITLYVFSDADPTKSWTRRRNADKGAAELVAKMEKVLQLVSPIQTDDSCPISYAPTPPASPPATTSGYQPKTRLGHALFGKNTENQPKTTKSTPPPTPPTKTGYQPKTFIGRAIFGSPDDGSGSPHGFGRIMAGRLLGSGKSIREVAQILVGTASAFVANTACAFAQLIDFYLRPENAEHWNKIKSLAAQGSPAEDQILKKYILEGYRLSNSLGLFRYADPVDGDKVQITQNGQTITATKGDRIFVSFIAAGRDPTVFPSPNEIRLDRPEDAYITFGQGPHKCLGKDLNIVHTLAMLKVVAGLKNLRRTPGDQGRLPCITKQGGIKLYMTPDWSQLTPYPTTMKLMWDE